MMANTAILATMMTAPRTTEAVWTPEKQLRKVSVENCTIMEKEPLKTNEWLRMMNAGPCSPGNKEQEGNPLWDPNLLPWPICEEMCAVCERGTCTLLKGHRGGHWCNVCKSTSNLREAKKSSDESSVKDKSPLIGVWSLCDWCDKVEIHYVIAGSRSVPSSRQMNSTYSSQDAL